MLRNILGLERKVFDNSIIDWAIEFGFIIDGDFIIIKNADIDGFIADLDKQFKLWEREEVFKQGK